MRDMAISEQTIPVWDGKINLKFQIIGKGPALVYLHPAAGLAWDPVLRRLAEQFTIYAPEFPGTSVGDPYAIYRVDDLSETVLFYEEALRKLDLTGIPVVGQSFGGMLALELAAAYPGLFSQAVVLDPIGLWSDSAPVANWGELPPTELPGLLFKYPESERAKAALALPSDSELAIKAQAQLVWNLGCTGKMVWPIPDLGLSRRLHRIQARCLIIWGEDDALINASYAERFGRAINGSTVEIIPDCGHIPQIEQPDATLDKVLAFLGKQSVDG